MPLRSFSLVTTSLHNSAFVDKQNRSFVVYHTRFSNGGEGHQVRVHQLFLNDEGWLMAAPFEFDGETITDEAIASKASIADADIAPGQSCASPSG